MEQNLREELQYFTENEADDISISKIILDQNDPRFELIQDIIVSAEYNSRYDGYLVNNEAIIKRLSDGKFFKVKYEDDDSTITWQTQPIEVYPYTHEVTGYL